MVNVMQLATLAMGLGFYQSHKSSVILLDEQLLHVFTFWLNIFIDLLI